MKQDFSFIEMLSFFLISISATVSWKNRYILKIKGVNFLKMALVFLAISFLSTNLENFFLNRFFNIIEHMFIGVGGIFLILFVFKNK